MALTNEAFEGLMAQGGQLHAARDYDRALAVRYEAWHLTSGDSLDAGRAARDIAATYDRQRSPDDAHHWSHRALNIHNGLLESVPTVLRERAASAMYVGSVMLRKAVVDELGGSQDSNNEENPRRDITAVRQNAWSYLRSAMKNIELAEKAADIPVDQYRVNITGRASMAESLYGSRTKGLVLGITAVGLAARSESRANPTSGPTLSAAERVKAKGKAFQRGVAALGISVLASPKPNLRRRTALKVAQKAL